MVGSCFSMNVYASNTVLRDRLLVAVSAATELQQSCNRAVAVNAATELQQSCNRAVAVNEADGSFHLS